VHRLYGFLGDLFAELTPAHRKDCPAGVIKPILQAGQFDQLVDKVRELGLRQRADMSLQTAKTIHDLRGGALTALISHLDRLADKDDARLVPPMLFALVRDHRKIMRNVLTDLDPERSENDTQRKPHTVELIVDKWSQATLFAPTGPVDIRLDCRHPHGTISERCMESAALDRTLYNILNNAAAHTSAPEIDFQILHIPAEEGAGSLRFIVSNQASPGTKEALSQFTTEQDNLGKLFAPGASTTGSGLGLAIAAEFVASCYGLYRREDAVTEGYLGARLLGSEFVAWLHWPLSMEPANVEREKQDAYAEVT
jgi:signal transduction histidine kinase